MIWGTSDRFEEPREPPVETNYQAPGLLKKSYNKKFRGRPEPPTSSPSSSSMYRSKVSSNSRSIKASRIPHLHTPRRGVKMAKIKGLRPGSALEGLSMVSHGIDDFSSHTEYPFSMDESQDMSRDVSPSRIGLSQDQDDDTVLGGGKSVTFAPGAEVAANQDAVNMLIGEAAFDYRMFDREIKRLRAAASNVSLHPAHEKGPVRVRDATNLLHGLIERTSGIASKPTAVFKDDEMLSEYTEYEALAKEREHAAIAAKGANTAMGLLEHLRRVVTDRKEKEAEEERIRLSALQAEQEERVRLEELLLMAHEEREQRRVDATIAEEADKQADIAIYEKTIMSCHMQCMDEIIAETADQSITEAHRRVLVTTAIQTDEVPPEPEGYPIDGEDEDVPREEGEEEDEDGQKEEYYISDNDEEFWNVSDHDDDEDHEAWNISDDDGESPSRHGLIKPVPPHSSPRGPDTLPLKSDSGSSDAGGKRDGSALFRELREKDARRQAQAIATQALRHIKLGDV